MTASAEQVRSSAKKLGINVEFVNKVPGKNPNADGAYNPKTNTIYINNNTKYPMQQVFLHELTHFFESADNYSEFQNTVFKSRAFKKWLGKYTNIKKDKYKSIDEYRNALKERYGEKDDTKINREMVAFFVSDNLFQKDFGDLGRLVTELKGSKKERFISFIKNIFKRFKNAVSGLDKLEKKFLSLYRTAGQNKNTDNNNGVKYEINTNFANDIKTWDRNGKSDEESFILGSTGDVLQGLGARENDIYINGSKINTILRDHPEMSLDVIKKIPEILENPILVLSSKNKVKNNTRMVMFGRINAENGKPVLCVLDLIPKENKIVLDDMQKAVSAYSKTNGSEDIKSFFENSEVLYASKNKKITTNLLTRVGFSMPTDLLKSGYIGSITYGNENVNIKGKPFNEVFSYDTNNSISENAENDTDIPQMNTGEDIDSEYMSAVENGDTDTAQRLVDEEAKAKGYNSPMLYHGTADFGFTEFDLNKMDDNRSIFLTSSKEIASTYSGIERINKISERNNVDVDKLSIQETVELLNRHGQEPTIDYSYSYMDMKDILELRKKVKHFRLVRNR